MSEINDFSELNLNSQLLKAIEEVGYTNPTPIQAGIIPIMLSGQDVIGQAQTGTGKTAAFALPILNNLKSNEKYVQALVLAPTRELAIQVADSIIQYGKTSRVRVLPVYGGQAYGHQVGALRRGVDVVVGTPGRILDLIKQKKLYLNRVSTVVLDEADEMLSMGFISDIEAILEEVPSERQTALFSATLPKAIRNIADRYMFEPQSCTIKNKQLTVDTVAQSYYLVNERDKLAALTRLFEMEDITSALIFARTRLGTGELANELSVRGFPAEALNGDLSQDARVRVLSRFRNNQIKVLVATDVAARGLDIDDITHVFNFDLPEDPEVYVHRIGRTGRAGRTGTAISIITPKERWRLRKIETYTRQRITEATLPTIDEIKAKRQAKLVEELMVWLRRGRCRNEKGIVVDLAVEGYDPVEIAAAALRLARNEEKQRPIAPISEVKTYSPREQRRPMGKWGQRRPSRDRVFIKPKEKGMVRFALNKGADDGLSVNHVVGAISHNADIPGRSIGKIIIERDHSFVDIPEQYAEKVMANNGSYRVGRGFMAVKRA